MNVMAPSEPHRLRVLIVEDDVALSRRVESYLTSNGVSVTTVVDLTSARALLALHVFDVVVLDLILEHEDGLMLTREFATHGGPPIIITSGRLEEADRVLGLELGADDYLIKPYSFRELLARIRVVRRRSQEGTGLRARHILHFGDWIVDLTARTVASLAGTHVQLTQGELELLRVFLEHPHRVLSRSTLLSLTSHDDANVFERTIDVLVARLRHKLESDPNRPTLIQTVRGEGYRFSQNVTWEESRD
jgi:two-component system OmpR family response regulator